VADPPDPAGRDYTLLHEAAGDPGTPVNFEPDPRVVTLSGKRIVLEAQGDTRFYDAVHNRPNLQRLNIYAEELVVRAPVKLPQTELTIYARELRFEDPPGAAASLDTTPETRTALDGNGAGSNGGDITLYVARIGSSPTSAPRLILRGGDSEVGCATGCSPLRSWNRGLCRHPGRRGTGAPNGRREPASGRRCEVPTGYRWVHPLPCYVLLYA
jgi:hypothetical protein